MVKPIPDGMHTVTPHLIVENASAALDFYAKAFGAVELSRLPGPEGKIMHASFRIGNSVLFMADAFPQWGSFGPAALKGPSGGEQHRENGRVRVADGVNSDPTHHRGDGAIRFGLHPGGAMLETQVRQAG